MPELVSQREFARRNGWNPGYVAKLKSRGRLVMDGDKVDVAASLSRIEESRDPAKHYMRDVNAMQRGGRGGAGDSDIGVESRGDEPRQMSTYQKARAAREVFDARIAEVEFKKLVGRLADTEEVAKAAFRVARAARNALFNLQHRLDPLLHGETDPARRAALWDRELRQLCDTLAKSCEEQTRVSD